jgi:hypothetical protein
MSNRLLVIGRIPLIPDPEMAMRAGALFADAIALTDRAIQYKNGFFAPTTTLMSALRRFRQIVERAVYLRDLSVMCDRELAIRGVRRDGIRDLFFEAPRGEFRYQPDGLRAGDR